jgi:hypothetical protein
LEPWVETVRLLRRDIPVLSAADGTTRGGRRQTGIGRRVQSYIVRAFGHRLRALGRSRQNRSGR